MTSFISKDKSLLCGREKPLMLSLVFNHQLALSAARFLLGTNFLLLFIKTVETRSNFN